MRYNVLSYNKLCVFARCDANGIFIDKNLEDIILFL